MSEREEKFEKMLAAVQERYKKASAQMEKLKVENKTKTVTYKQLMAEKLTCQNMLNMYRIYGLLEEEII